MNFFDKLEELEKRKIYFCFQSQGGSSFYNLSVADRNGKIHYYNGGNIQHLEDWLEIFWKFDKSTSFPVMPSFPRLKN